MTEPEAMGRQAEQSDWLDHAVRVGLLAYGVVHLLIGWLAIQLAFGDHSEEASAQGALQKLSEKPFGQTMVWSVAVGMALLVLWRVLEAAFGHREEEGADRLRKRLTSGAKAVVYGAMAATATKVAVSGGATGGSHGERAMTAKLMDLPAGQWIVAAIGLAIVAYGGSYVWRGWTEKFAEHLDTEGKLGWSGAGYLLLGRVGHVAKGIAFAIVGILVAYAGITRKPGKSGGLDEALQTLLRQPFGPILLIAIGAGIACFGLFCFARARHLDR